MAPQNSSDGFVYSYLGYDGLDLALSDYQQTWQLQRDVHAQVAVGEIGPQVLFVQHPPVYTAGRRTQPQERPQDGTPVVDVDRGGKITYHGPGQLVGYPIIRLTRTYGPLEYVRRIEQAVMDMLQADFGVSSIRVEGRTGVWLPAQAGRPERKICAIGVRVARMTTMHGFALNVAREATGPFGNIIPCGIADAGVTSIEEEIGTTPPTLMDVAHAIEPQLARQLSFTLTAAGRDALV